MYDKILLFYKKQLQKALSHLRYSYQKVRTLPTDPEKLDEESLETWESFCARFSRVVDLFLTKYLRARVWQDDPGFQGTLRDFVSQGEKLGLVENTQKWMELRALRNIEAHTYSEDLKNFLEKLREKAPLLFEIEKKL